MDLMIRNRASVSAVASGTSKAPKVKTRRRAGTEIFLMNTFEQQDARARQSVNWTAALKVGLGMGLYLFIFSGGTPWTGAGTANGVLGRAYEWPWLATAVVHFALCLIYLNIVALVVYRLNIWIAVFGGAATTAALYGVTYPLLATHNAGDTRALFSHLILGLFGAALYKAISVPKLKSA